MNLSKEELDNAYASGAIKDFDTYLAMGGGQAQSTQPTPEAEILSQIPVDQQSAMVPAYQVPDASVPILPTEQAQSDVSIVPPQTDKSSLSVSKPEPSISVSGGSNYTEKAYKESQKLYKEADQVIRNQEAQRLKDEELRTKHLEQIDNEFTALKDKHEQFMQAKDIDPGRYYANASTGAKIAALLGAAFGGYASAYTGGKNVGLEAINKTIDDDIKAQVNNFEKAKSQIDAQKSLFGTMYQITKDKDTAMLASRTAMTESVLKRLDVMASKAKTAQDVDNINLKKQELQLKAQTEQQALKAKMMENANSAYQAQKVISGPYAASSKYVVDNLPQLIKDNKVKIVETPVGVPLVTDNEKFSEQASNANQTHAIMMQGLDELSKVQKAGLFDINSMNEFDRIKTNIITTIKQQKALGALDNGLLEFSDRMLSGIKYNNFTSDSQKAIKSFKSQMDNEYTSLLKATYPVGKDNIKSMESSNEEDKKSGKKISFK